jgi:pimeloyl-ACP methyl ester carboxylesterase
MHYKLLGPENSETPLVLVHGTGGSAASCFDPLVDHFIRSRRLLMVDLPGHGETPSAKPPIRTLSELTETVLETCRSLGFERAHWIGHSLGAVLGLDASLRWPGVQSLTLIDPPILFPKEVAAGMCAVREQLAGPDYPQHVRSFARGAFFTPDTDPELRERIVEQVAGLSQEDFIAIWGAQGAFDAQSALRDLKVPCLLLHGITPMDVGLFRSLVPGAKIVEIPEGGHYPQLEVPSRVIGLIEMFLGEAAMTATTPVPLTSSERKSSRQANRTRSR